MAGARPNRAHRRMATAVQPAMASSADSPVGQHQPVLEPPGQLEGEALVGSGAAELEPGRLGGAPELGGPRLGPDDWHQLVGGPDLVGLDDGHETGLGHVRLLIGRLDGSGQRPAGRSGVRRQRPAWSRP